MKRASLSLIVTLLIIVATAPAHAGLAANVDLAVLRVTTNISSANAGQRLVFRSVAKNLGPDAVPDGDSFDVQYVHAVNIQVKAEHCIIRARGGRVGGYTIVRVRRDPRRREGDRQGRRDRADADGRNGLVAPFLRALGGRVDDRP